MSAETTLGLPIHLILRMAEDEGDSEPTIALFDQIIQLRPQENVLFSLVCVDDCNGRGVLGFLRNPFD